MHTYRKWVLTLGIMALTPGLTMAGPFSFLKRKSADESTAAASRSTQSGRRSNQQVAELIASALRAGGLTGHDIEIEYKNGVARLAGKIGDASQKAHATRLLQRIPEVKQVDNRLIPIQQIVQTSAIQPAKSSPIQQTAFESSDSDTDNQAVAEEIAAALSSASLNGYDIEIHYQDGTATLAGSVANAQQRANAAQVVSNIAGVGSVNNQLRVAGAPQAPPRSAPPGYRPAPQFSPTSYQPQPPAAGQGAVPAAYGYAGPSNAQPVLNNPSTPSNAWPSYASYPNYAQVTYPTQYSASAWPYIGPFYPYPQVPLGWRQVQLEWDDGNWNLNFRPRTERWWWFLNPTNW